MSAVRIAELVAIVALVVAGGAGLGLALVFRKLQRYQRSQHVIMGSRRTVDIIEHVSTLDEKLTNVRLALEDLTLAARDHDVRIDSTLSRVGIVRFDAYQDLGGRQSTAVAFLNSRADGVVITTVVSRDFARMYVKLLREGTPDIPLAPEETEAVEQARGSGPFTIRPRVEGEVDLGPRADAQVSVPPEDMVVSMGLPGRRPRNERELARENRRRTRERLPLVEDAVVPSATGWAEPRTPSPTDGSMAERFLRERKSARRVQDDGETGPETTPAEDTNDRDL